MYTEDDLLPLSGVQHVVYCERRFGLVQVEGLWEESSATVEGREVHARAHEVGTEVRGDLRVGRGLWLRSWSLGLSGKTDVVEFHRVEPEDPGCVALPGVAGSWRVFPVEYKRGVLRHELAYAVQLCAQAMALEEMLGGVISRGAVYYGKSHCRQEVEFSGELRHWTMQAAGRIHEIVRSGVTPPPVPGPKCGPCSMRGLCLPEGTARGGRASAYFTRALRDAMKSGP